MFKNDRMMTILTGLVLAIFAGTMVKYGDRIIALMSGDTQIASHDDSYSVRAGSSQILDVLSNDEVIGPIVVLSRPSCGAVELTGNNKVSFSSNTDCSGVIEFAYCVDNEGSCAPNAVKINVIAVNFAQPTPASQPESNSAQPVATAQNNDTPVVTTPEPVIIAQAPQPSGSFGTAPVVGGLNSTSMSPPPLATPSIPELVSPSLAVASIRHSSGGLTQSNNTDQNITAQNSAGATQAASVDPSAFQAPSMGEDSSNVTLGGGSRVAATNIVAPTTLQPASNTSGSNIVQLERGPVALAAIQSEPVYPAAQEAAPLSASDERNTFAPVEVAATQTPASTPDTIFNATPIDGGPIALVALQSTRISRGASGESLNVILSEPGEQQFASALVPPSALAPASSDINSVSVLEHAPNLIANLLMPAAPAPEFGTQIFTSLAQDGHVVRSPLTSPSLVLPGVNYATNGALIAASSPNQVSVPSGLATPPSIASVTRLENSTGLSSRTQTFTLLSNPATNAIAPPSINMLPAERPAIQQANLPVEPVAPVIVTEPVQNSVCAITLTADALSGANIALDINAACKPEKMVTISHAGISFSVQTDSHGSASLVLPAMQQDSEITVKFEDQSSSTVSVTVNDMETVLRAGVSWQFDMNLDINAFEYGAAVGSEGHVTPEAPRDFRTSRIRGGGYLEQLGDPSLDGGALAEVYTILVNRNQQRGTVALSILIDDAEHVCGQDIVAKTSRSREGRTAAVRNVRFTVPACGTIASQIILPGAIDDIRLAGR